MSELIWGEGVADAGLGVGVGDELGCIEEVEAQIFCLGHEFFAVFLASHADDGALAGEELVCGVKPFCGGFKGFGDDEIEGLWGEVFDAAALDLDLVEFEAVSGDFEEVGALLARLDECDGTVGEEDFERDAREAGAGADVEDGASGLARGSGDDAV